MEELQEQTTATITWPNFKQNAHRLWTSCKSAFWYLCWERTAVWTQHVIPSEGWSAIYKGEHSFTTKPLICLEINYKDGEAVEVIGIVFSPPGERRLPAQVNLGLPQGFQDAYVEPALESDDFAGYLAPGQTLDEWVAIARSNGINYEFGEAQP